MQRNVDKRISKFKGKIYRQNAPPVRSIFVTSLRKNTREIKQHHSRSSLKLIERHKKNVEYIIYFTF